MALAKDHLTDGGVYLQWMNTQFVDEFLLRSLCATMLDVFPHVRVYQWDPEVLFFLGSNEPLEVEAGIIRSGRPLSDDILGYLEKGVGSVEDLVAAQFSASVFPVTVMVEPERKSPCNISPTTAGTPPAR